MTVSVYAGCVNPDALHLSVELRDRTGSGRSSQSLSVPVPRGKSMSCWDALMPEVVKALKYESLEEAQKEYDFSVWTHSAVHSSNTARLRDGHTFAELTAAGQVSKILLDSESGQHW